MAILVTLGTRLAAAGHERAESVHVQSVADAAAIAGVLGSRVGAESIAVANGARLEIFEVTSSPALPGSIVRVVVATDTARASAWATDGG